MLRIARTLIAALALVAVAPVHADLLRWNANLGGANEIPGNASTATGSGYVLYDTVTHVLTLFLEWQGLTGPGVQAHIHCCVASPPGNVGIAIDLWLSSDPRPATGSYTATYDLDTDNPFRAAFVSANGGTVFSAFAALQAALSLGSRAYYNIHTGQFPGGEIRGNLVVEPTTLALIGIAVIALALLRRKR